MLGRCFRPTTRLESDDGARAQDHGVFDGFDLAVAEDVAASGMHDVLKCGRNRPTFVDFRDISRGDIGLIIAQSPQHSIKGVVRVERAPCLRYAHRRTQCRIYRRDGGHCAGYGHAGIGVKIDEVSLIFGARGRLRKDADIAFALMRSLERIEHLLKHGVDAVVGLNLGRLIGQRRS